MKKLNILNSLSISIFIFSILILFSPFVYFGICLLNEHILGYGKNINYCVIKSLNDINPNSEYQLIGIRRWQLTNKVLGVYPNAQSAWNAATQMNCQIDDNR